MDHQAPIFRRHAHIVRIFHVRAIERVEPPAGLQPKLAKAGRTETPSLYAEAGLWYDAIAAVSALIDSAPGDLALRRGYASATLAYRMRSPRATAYDSRDD